MKLTLLFIAINILVFIFTVKTNFVIHEDYASSYGFSVNNFLAGKYHTLITSLFLHGDLIHLLSNIIVLVFLGLSIEEKIKDWQYLLIYFLAGTAGNLLMFIPIFGYTAETIGIGASASISGLIGLGTFICPGKMVIFGGIIPLPFIFVGALYFIFTLSNLFIQSIIAYPAHLGGISVGALFGLVWGKDRLKRIIIFIFICLLIISLPYIVQLVVG